MMMINKKIIKCHVTRGIRTKTRVASTNRRYQYHLRTQRSQMIPLLAKSTSIEQIQRHNYCMGTVSTESAYGNNKYLPAMISTSSWPASEDEEADFTFVIDNKCKFALEVQDEMSLESDNSNDSLCLLLRGGFEESDDEESILTEEEEHDEDISYSGLEFGNISTTNTIDLDNDLSFEGPGPLEEQSIEHSEGEHGTNMPSRNLLAVQLRQTNPIGARYNMDATLPNPGVQRHFLGEMSIECSYCNAIGFIFEKKGTRLNPHFGRLCCNGGKSKFMDYPYLPDDLMDLFLGTNHRANYFLKNLRYFNAGMAMASLTAAKDATIQKTVQVFTGSKIFCIVELVQLQHMRDAPIQDLFRHTFTPLRSRAVTEQQEHNVLTMHLEQPSMYPQTIQDQHQEISTMNN